MAERPAVNASPLIFLTQGDILDFLRLAGSEIVVPAPVAEEIQRRGATPGMEAIVDDLAARRCTAALGLPVRGTLGLVLTARRRGIIPAARPVVERLRHCSTTLSRQ